MSESKVLLGIDVGSSSVRALVMDSASGQILATAIETLEIRHSAAGWAEQSSDQIWTATCNAVRHALHSAAVNSGRVVGIGFDATSSLVVLDYAGIPFLTFNSHCNADAILQLLQLQISH
jgi:D-ribulokinase